MSKNHSTRSALLAATIAGILASSSAYSAAAETDLLRGKVLDNSSTASASVTDNTEFNTSLQGLDGPSRVITRDLKAMRASAVTLPTQQATRELTLSDADQGALFESGRDELLPASRTQLDRIADSLRGKRNLRFAIVGHADAQRLSAATRKRFGDNQGLSEARAYQVAQYLRANLGLSVDAFTVRGEGDRKPIADNGTPAGMAKNRRVELQVWYDDEIKVATAPPVAAADRIECSADNTTSTAPLRITVDGQALTPADQVTEADHQRCVDVTVNRHNIRIQYDALKTQPALNVVATPNGAVVGQPITFATYSNYQHWIRRAELRFFAVGQDPREKPLLVLPVQIGTSLTFTPDAHMPANSYYTLRVYDEKNRFDETALKQLQLLDRARPLSDVDTTTREQLVGYGESSLKVHNIPVTGGTVTVSGDHASADETVTVFGAQTPIDAQGRFVTQQLLPQGTHTVEVETQTSDGQYSKYARNFDIASESWFYVALGELTVAKNNTTGPALLVTQDTERYSKDTEVTGRGAFYAKGKFDNDYSITLSADTRERPIEDLFSNFTSKDPRFLLERIDADRAYPVYGDNSTSEWDAPTDGHFYARVDHHDSRAVWGNFQTAWTGLEFNQFSRGLYGADLTLKSDSATSFGERRSTNDAFAAEPGTLNSREEFRGTGGSLYYLHRQDITRGSERLWVEIRDETSGITLQRTQLIPGSDYELSYLQGRILLRAPLPSIADGSSLVQQGSLSGHPVFLVSSYEYSPLLNEADSNVYGLRSSTWLNDYVRVGVSGYRQGDQTDRQQLGGVDMTLRYKPSTYLDIEGARSDGAASQLSSINGGFGFNQSTTASTQADAKRVQGVFDLSDFSSTARGRGSVYWQDRDAGFSGIGALAAGVGIEQQGAAFSAPIGTRTSVDVKADHRDSDTQRIDAQEAALHQQLNDRWSMSLGGKHDDRSNSVPNASALLSQNGERTDAIMRFDYKPFSTATSDANNATNTDATAMAANRNTEITGTNVASDLASQVNARPASWQAYSYVQGTLNRSGDRDENNRGGIGAEKQINDRFRVGGEASDGSGGTGGKLSGDYRVDDRSNVYLSHTVETEQPDSNYRGKFGNTVLGSRTKLSDHINVYDEARDSRGAGPNSLTNAFGVDLAPNDRWNYGVKLEAGTVSDPLAGDLKRHAAGISAAYKFEQVKFTSAIEYRHEDSLTGTRTTWLSRNTTAYQATPDWRLLGKANFSFSKATQGNFYDGNFIDASLGGAYRPVANDKWNALVQYRYYYVLPSAGQVNLNDESLDYAQRSHVVSMDAIYDVKPWLSLGGKYAQRFGALRDTRVSGPWYSSRADLIILRSDLHLIREWDMMLEGRRLTVHEAEDVRTGMLTALYRHLNKNVKLGAGYNFTDFSDDLTDLSYRSRGPFINIVSVF